MIISRPRDAGFIDPRTSIAPMLDALDVVAGQVTVELCEPPTLPRLEEMISAARKTREPFHIVHFDGHGTYLPHTGIGALAFESTDDEDRTELVEGRKLGDLLVRLEVPLVLLAAAERGLDIERALGRIREIAASLGRIAAILTEQNRHAEADARYAEAVAGARAAGDLGLQGTLVQHQAGLQHQTGKFGRAIKLGKEALALFQQAGDTRSEMQTCSLLGSAEQQLGHLDAAAAWYARGRELAEKRNDRAALAIIAQNVGILHQTGAEQADDPDLRTGHMLRAVAAIEESLAISLEMTDQVGAAASYFQLGVLQQMLGDLARAEENLHRSLAVHESLNLPDVYKVYADLALVARDRGDAEAAAAWEAKYDAKVAELERLHRGGDGPADLSAQLAAEVLALAQAAFNARVQGGALPPQAAEAVARLAAQPGRWARSAPSSTPSRLVGRCRRCPKACRRRWRRSWRSSSRRSSHAPDPAGGSGLEGQLPGVAGRDATVEPGRRSRPPHWARFFKESFRRSDRVNLTCTSRASLIRSRKGECISEVIPS